MIPNYNGAAFLGKCLDSLAQQSWRDREVIVVDNGSQDDSLWILEKHPLQPKIIRLENNLGFSRAVNSGMEQASGELIALLNNDACAAPDWLEKLSAAAEKHPEMDFFACLILQREHRDKIESAGVGYSLQARPKPVLENEPLPGRLGGREIFLASGAGVMLRENLIKRIGKLDPDYFAYLEDLDFFLRARLSGARGMLVSEAVVYHLGAGTELRDDPGRKRMESGQRVYLIARNRWYLIWDNLPGSIIILLWPLMLLGWLRGLGYHLFRSGQILHFLAGTSAGFFSLFRRRKKRRMVKRLRRIKPTELLSWMKTGIKELK